MARLLALVGSRFYIPETLTISPRLVFLLNIELTGRNEFFACKIFSNWQSRSFSETRWLLLELRRQLVGQAF